MSVFTNPAGAALEHARAYVSAILDLLGDQDPLTVLRETPNQLARVVQTTPRHVLSRPEAPGKWSMGQVLAHLADSDLVWGWRLRLILSQDRPSLTGYDQDAWADRLAYADIDPKDSVEMFSVLRRSNLRLVERASPEDLQRLGVHVERGEESLAHHLKLYAGHDILHLNQLERIRTTVG
ncbi:MAG TPA: DinB family protein [Gemmatimonadaceae bacterium]